MKRIYFVFTRRKGEEFQIHRQTDTFLKEQKGAWKNLVNLDMGWEEQ